ncbi:endonuclease/exonuclease/phosphatase family protein [Methylibium sp.]|uniref:endonuclease/exonuclease/phosphatase family protein n=1 Tax=Methylibium sp. TaxID=2067992 RepID=UPI0025D333B5|nr:endonuclease/exonuclease/phosphatase family protein [Methylibium sp.]
METALLIVGGVMVAATLLPLLRFEAWWIRVFDFPRLQISFVLVIVAAARLAIGVQGTAETLFLLALLASLGLQARRMYPYTRLARKEVEQSAGPKPGSTLSLLCANVLQSNHQAERLKDIIREADPDLILALETDTWWQGQLDEFALSHPHHVHQPQDNTYGMLLYSRLELQEPSVTFLVEEGVPSIHARVRLRSGQMVQLHCMHPRPPSPTENDRSTERDAEMLIVGREIKRNPSPVVVFGDLNDVAWSRTNDLFKQISGLLDPRVGRGFFNTFNAKHRLIRFPLDHFFHSNDFRLVAFRRLDFFGSDHFPVFIELSLEPHAAHAQEEPQADAAEQNEASEKIEQATG